MILAINGSFSHLLVDKVRENPENVITVSLALDDSVVEYLDEEKKHIAFSTKIIYTFQVLLLFVCFFIKFYWSLISLERAFRLGDLGLKYLLSFGSYPLGIKKVCLLYLQVLLGGVVACLSDYYLTPSNTDIADSFVSCDELVEKWGKNKC